MTPLNAFQYLQIATIAFLTFLTGCGYQLNNPVKKTESSPNSIVDSSSSSSGSTSGASSGSTSSVSSADASALGSGWYSGVHALELRPCDPVKAALAPFGAGDGSVGDPYEIHSVAQLDEVRNFLSSSAPGNNFELMCDIDLTGIAFNALPEENFWWNELMVNGNAVGLYGTFEGNGFRILNWTHDSAGGLGSALFMLVGAGGTIQNLGIEGLQLTGCSYCGGLALVHDGVISSAFVNGSIRGDRVLTGNTKVWGGLVAAFGVFTGGGSISDSYAILSIRESGTTESCTVGGIYGEDNGNGTTVDRVYSIISFSSTCDNQGTIYGVNYGGTPVVYNDTYSLTDHYFGQTDAGITSLTTSEFSDVLSFSNFAFPAMWQMPATDNYTVSPILWWQDTSTPFLTGDPLTLDPSDPSSICDPSNSTIGGGTGSNTYPYLICRDTHLQYLATKPHKTFKLMSDLSLTGQEWVPISSFYGILDGNSKVISGLTITASAGPLGLFAYLGNATISNLSLTAVDINTPGESQVGALSGSTGGTETLSDITVSGSIIGNGSVGGLLGQGGGNISDITLTGLSVLGNSNGVGGLIGAASSSTQNSIQHINFSSGSVSGLSSVGGIIGDSTSDIAYSYLSSSVDVTCSSTHCGGLFGNLQSGGPVRQSSLTDSSVASGVAVQGTDYTGGIVGSLQEADLSDVTSGATVSGASSVGGLIGTFWPNCSYGDMLATISSSSSTGAVTGTNSNTGGLVGLMTYQCGVINNSFSTSLVNGTSVVGGFVGMIQGGVIQESYSTGTVTGSANSIGGFVGAFFPTNLTYTANINRSYSISSVSGNAVVGGFVGTFDSWNGGITDAYYAGASVSGGTEAGGFAGYVTTNGIANSISAPGSVSMTAGGGDVVYGSDPGIAFVGYYYPNPNVLEHTSWTSLGTDVLFADLGTLGSYGLLSFGHATNDWKFANAGANWPLPIFDWQDSDTPFPNGTPFSPIDNSDCVANRTPFGNGSGSNAHPFLLCDPDHFQGMVDTRLGYWYYKLTTNIDMAGESWPHLLDWIGYFDGNEKTISNISIATDSGMNTIGFFSSIGGTPSSILGLNVNSIIVNADAAGISGGTYGLIAGQNNSNLLISGVTVAGTIVATNGHGNSGGFIGLSNGLANIVRSSVLLTLQGGGGTSMGGAVGEGSVDLYHVVSRGTMTGANGNNGGLVGKTYNYVGINEGISNSYSTVTITDTGAGVNGGLVGYLAGIPLSTSYYGGTGATITSSSGFVSACIGADSANGANSSFIYFSSASTLTDSYCGQINLNNSGAFTGFQFDTSNWEMGTGAYGFPMFYFEE